MLSHSAAFYSTRRLIEVATARGLRPQLVDPVRVTLDATNLAAPLQEDGGPLPRFDLALPRIGATLTEWSLALLEALVASGAHPLVPAHALRDAQDKLTTAVRLAAAGVPTVRTVALREPAHIDDALAAVGGAPVVIKLRHGTQGRHVMSAPTTAAARSVLGSLTSLGHACLIQPWLRAAPDGARPRDLRVLVVGGRAVAGCWREAPPDDFRSNVHQGAGVVAARLDDDSRSLAERAARAVDLPVCGVDLMPTTEHGLVVLEVNGSPGLEGIEAATGLDLAGMIVDSF